MPGPAPKHPSRRARSNSNGAVVTLPAGGRSGEVPAWPLGPDVSLVAAKQVADSMVCDLEEQLAAEDDGRRRRTILRQLEKARVQAETLGVQLDGADEAELGLWAELWATPQAVEWERAHAHRAVAQYVRWQVRGENGDLDAAKEARQWSDRLGMNPLALQKLRQEVERTGDVEDRGRARRERAKSPAKSAGAGRPDPRAALRAV